MAQQVELSPSGKSRVRSFFLPSFYLVGKGLYPRSAVSTKVGGAQLAIE